MEYSGLQVGNRVILLGTFSEWLLPRTVIVGDICVILPTPYHGTTWASRTEFTARWVAHACNTGQILDLIFKTL